MEEKYHDIKHALTVKCEELLERIDHFEQTVKHLTEESAAKDDELHRCREELANFEERLREFAEER